MSGNRFRLRAINGGQGPVSTMNRSQAGHSTRLTQDETDERASKRQKCGKATGTESNFFVKLTPGRKGGYQDLTEDTSQGQAQDTVDILSVSSAGAIPTVAATSSQTEYRKVSQQNSVKPNSRPRRRSRNPSLVGTHKPAVDRLRQDSIAIDDREDHTRVESSPDIISPPPANVVSDIAPAAQKRSRPTHLMDSAQPPIKRPKNAARPESIESEDELSVQTASPSRKNQRITNFDKITPRVKAQGNRGDIQRTNFKTRRSPEQKMSTDSSLPEFQTLQVIKAASGRYTHPSNDEKETTLTLTLGKVGAVASLEGSESPQRQPWFNLDLKTIQSIEHCATKSPHMFIKRRLSYGSPLLCLEFNSVQDATFFFAWISDLKVDFQESDSEHLEKKFKHQFSVSKRYYEAQGNPQKAAETTESPSGGKFNESRFFLSETTKSDLRDPFNPEANSPPANRRRATLVSAMGGTQGMETRRTRRLSPLYQLQQQEPSPAPNRWSVLTPNWEKDWKTSLVYPATGKNRTTVDKDDIPRLDEAEFLNDNLINFYFRYLQIMKGIENPDALKNVYFFSTFFYEKLRSNRGKLNYDGVKSWTAKIDLLSYKYIIVPVNENAHWYLAIIYNAPRLLSPDKGVDGPKENGANDIESLDTRSSPELATVERDISFISLEDEPVKPRTRSERILEASESSPATVTASQSQDAPAKSQARKSTTGDLDAPRIITLDSLGSPHSPTCRYLREYLTQEAESKKNIKLTVLPAGMTGKNIPEQNNYCDCGVFILGYVEEFLKDPDEAIRKLLQKEDLGWKIDPVVTRINVRNLLFRLQKEQQDRLDEEAKEKKQKRTVKRKLKDQATAALAASVEEPRREDSKETVAPEGAPEKQSKPDTIGVETNGLRHSIEPKQNSPAESVPQRSPQRSSPSKRRVVTPAKKARDEIDLIDQLDETSEGKPESSIKITRSTQTSPVKKPILRAAVDLTGPENKPSRTGTTPVKTQPRDNFVRALSVTSDDITPSQVCVNERRTTSPEVTMVKRTRREMQMPAPYLHRSPKKPVPSIEVDPATGPQYDGVDTSIDLTAGSQ